MTGVAVVSSGCRGNRKKRKEEEETHCQMSLMTYLAATFKKSMAQCHLIQEENTIDIGLPSEVHHIAHVTFDRFHGFLGLPMEFELQVPSRAPSASVNVFGISPNSMHCRYDSKGNSVPIILLLMQERLYSQGGLKEEGIFRVNPENEKEKEVRQQLSKGVLPDDIDVHCLASLIKAWFRELPEGVMDTLSPGQVLQCETEEDYANLVNLLPPTQFALFNWTVELMVDVVEEEKSNKMNVRNIVMVFAPNMTHLSDPLTSLMHAVQVMNLLKSFVQKTSREREEKGRDIFCRDTSSPSSQETVSGEFSEDNMYDEQSDYGDENCLSCHDDENCLSCYDDENCLSCYDDKDMEEESLRRDSTCEYRRITEELVREVEECFLKQLDWKEANCNVDGSSDQATQLTNPYLEEDFCFSVLFEMNQDFSITSSVVHPKALPIKNAIKMIEGHEEVNHERMQSNDACFGTIVVGNLVKMMEERNGMIGSPIQEITTLDGGLNSGKAAAQDPNCVILF